MKGCHLHSLMQKKGVKFLIDLNNFIRKLNNNTYTMSKIGEIIFKLEGLQYDSR